MEPAAAGTEPLEAEAAGSQAAEVQCLPEFPEFSKDHWEVEAFKYGLMGLMRVRQVMLPIPKPPETAHLKFLICPKPDGNDWPKSDGNDWPETAEDGRRGWGSADGRGAGNGWDRGHAAAQTKPPSSELEGMGTTEELPDAPSRGQWWRNCAKVDVLIREEFDFSSEKVAKVLPGHYVQQAGPVQVFVSGQASGLQRMPVLPRGWATVDATRVGGPHFLEAVRSPRWKVIYSSGSNIGDIVVRKGMGLDSEEVALLTCGTFVEQRGAQESTAEGILRMPVSFGSGEGRDPSSPSQPPRQRFGWITPDARAQGGPQFVEPCPEEPLPTPMERVQASGYKGALGKGYSGGLVDEPWTGAPGPGGQGYPVESKPEGGAQQGPKPMESTRLWRVTLKAPDARLPVLARAETYVPGRSEPRSIVVCWLLDGHTVEQVGHSKKVKGCRIMPVRVLAADDPKAPEDSGHTGWVTRELFDKSRAAAGQDWVWFEELDETRDATRGERRRQRRQNLEAAKLNEAEAAEEC